MANFRGYFSVAIGLGLFFCIDFPVAIILRRFYCGDVATILWLISCSDFSVADFLWQFFYVYFPEALCDSSVATLRLFCENSSVAFLFIAMWLLFYGNLEIILCGDFSVGLYLWRLSCGDFTAANFLWQLFRGDVAFALWRCCRYSVKIFLLLFPEAIVLWRLLYGDFCVAIWRFLWLLRLFCSNFFGSIFLCLIFCGHYSTATTLRRFSSVMWRLFCD